VRPATIALLIRMRKSLIQPLLATLVIALCLAAPHAVVLAKDSGPGEVLPDACQTGCVSAYGTLLGTAAGGVPAYSNCRADCVVFVPNTEAGVYTGIRWQCVEFARRWLLQHQGAVYGDVDVAADIWDRIDHLERVADRSAIPLVAYPNGSRQAPAVGDLLIYARAFLGTGHVAVVTGMDLATHKVRVAEENYLNRKWPGDYAREIELVVRDGRYWLLDAYLLGWKHAAG
jgi:glutathionylspermidine amidase/synthetase